MDKQIRKTRNEVKIARIFALIGLVSYAVSATFFMTWINGISTTKIIFAVVFSCIQFVAFIVSFIKYYEHGRENIFDKIIYVFLWICFSILAILLIVFAGWASNEKGRKPAKTTDLGSGYIKQNEYGNYDMYVGNETSGYTKTSLQDYNSHSGEATDYKGNKYKID